MSFSSKMGEFIRQIPMLEILIEDAQTAYINDPAATLPMEVLLYPGVNALWVYRIASRLYQRDHLLVARFCSQLARLLTGVDIHPAATIGQRVFIDHAIGVVVGETSNIGDDVLIYHGATLGASDVTEGKRHPTLADGVTIGANASVLGPVTLGSNATIGAGSVVIDDVPAEATVVGVPAERV